MKKGLVLLANGFEDSEAIVTIDILKRAKIELDIVSVCETLEITTQCNNRIVLNKDISKCDLNDYDFLFIPGGKAVATVLMKSKSVEKTILDFAQKEKLIACICAAPSLLGKLGLLEKQTYTCFPGCEVGIVGKYCSKSVIVSNNYITGKSMGYSLEFALEIVNYLLGKEEMKKVEAAIYGKK